MKTGILLAAVPAEEARMQAAQSSEDSSQQHSESSDDCAYDHAGGHTPRLGQNLLVTIEIISDHVCLIE
jgi:hypothetical protein